MSPFLTTQELAARLRVSVQTIYNRRHSGQWPLKSYSEGRRVLYRLADVEAYEEQLKPAS